MEQHDLFSLFASSGYDDYKINYLNLFHTKLENDLENRQFEKDFQFYRDIASLLFRGGIKKSYIDVRVRYDHNTEFDFLFACRVNSKNYLVNIELTQNKELNDDQKIKQLKRHNKYLSQFYSQYNIITLLVNKIDDSYNYRLLDNDELQLFVLSQAKSEVEWDSNFKLEETTAINDFQRDWLTHEQYNKFTEIENLNSSIKYVWLKGNAGCGKTTIGLKLYQDYSTILLKCGGVSNEEQLKGIENFTMFKNKGQIKQHYDFLIVDECQSIVEEQLEYIKKNISNFDRIIFIGDEYQNYLHREEWEAFLNENKKQFKEIVLKEYLRQNEDTIRFFKYLCFDQKPKEGGVKCPQFTISRFTFKNIISLKHSWNNNEYNNAVAIGSAIGKTYKRAEVIIGKEYNNPSTMNALYVLLTRTASPIIYFEDKSLYNWFINKYYNYINEFIH